MNKVLTPFSSVHRSSRAGLGHSRLCCLPVIIASYLFSPHRFKDVAGIALENVAVKALKTWRQLQEFVGVKNPSTECVDEHNGGTFTSTREKSATNRFEPKFLQENVQNEAANVQIALQHCQLALKN